MINSALLQNTRCVGRNSRFSLSVAGLLTSLLLGQAAVAQSTEANGKVPGFEDLSITVQTGDSFSSIISRELQSLDAWDEIANYNKLEEPDRLSPGDVIVIPAKVLHARNYATVIFVKGVALHHNSLNNSKAAISKGDKIYTGDMVETDRDGFVSMSFNGGSSVNVQPDSTMKISVLDCTDRDEACEVNLGSEKGSLGLDVQSVGFDKPTVFSIDSPYASAAVRGTRFDFDIDDGNSLGVTEGTVEITLNGLRNDINVGKGVLAGEGRSINELFDLLPQPELVVADEVTRISDEDILNWQAIEDASSYLVAYALSESMQDAFTSFSQPGTIIKPGLPIGEYYLSARGVASNGLRGFKNVVKLASVAIDTAAEVPVFDVSVSDDGLRVTSSGAASDTVEVKIGNSLAELPSGEYLVNEQIYLMKGGETLNLEMDRASDWYLQGRAVIDEGTVSSYGLLYFFEKIGG